MKECSEIIGITKVNDIAPSAFLFPEHRSEDKLLEGQLSHKFTGV